MPSSPPSAPLVLPAPAEGLLELPRLPGRLRTARHWLILVPVIIASWIWFGVTGSVPVLIWWYERRPSPQPGPWRLDLALARSARLGPWRTWIVLRGAPRVEIFHDEMAPRDLARLRRALKSQLAAGFNTSSRSEKPGNRMVSSERGNVSG